MRAPLFMFARRGSVWLFILCCLALSACTAGRQGPSVVAPGPVSDEQAASVWAAYNAYAAAREAEGGPYRIGVSMRIGQEGDTRRVTGVVWSNGEAPRALQAPSASGTSGASGTYGAAGAYGADTAFSGPVRLDVMAGFGTVVARLREAPGEFMAFSPRENKALTYTGRGRVRLNMGLPAPFGLRDLSALLRGRFHEVFGRAGNGRALGVREGNVAYALEGSERAGTLELRPDGLPVRWREHGEQGWSMELDYAEDSAGGEGVAPLPRTLRLVDTQGRSAVVLVKNREKPAQRFTADQLALKLPAGVRIEPVREGR